MLRDDIPIYVASLGANSVEETAASANGWLPFMVFPERMDRFGVILLRPV